MSKVRLREANQAQSDGSTWTQAVPTRPLKVAGLLIHKADLLEAMRLYVPNARYIRVLEGDEDSLLVLSEGEGNEDTTAKQ